MPAPDTSVIKILIIDGQAIVRAGLRLLLDSSPGLRVIGDAGLITEAIALARQEQPDVILFEAASPIIVSSDSRFVNASADGREGLTGVSGRVAVGAGAATSGDASGQTLAASAPSPLFSFISSSFQDSGAMPDGVDFIPTLFEVAPDAQIIVLTGSVDAGLHRRVVAQGAKGLLQKDCSPEILIRAIECVYAGEVWIERAMMASVLAEIAQTGNSPTTPQTMPLTLREHEVIALLCEGLPNRQISSRLSISETTVRRHLTTIFAKLGVTDRLELVIYAYRHGLADAVEA